MLRRAHHAFWILLAVLGLGWGAVARWESPPRAEAFEEVLVSRVIDGDTIELASGEQVRYIGIDTPEVYDRVGSEWVYRPEPYAEEASTFNRRAVEGRTVRLEYDAERRDRFQRNLAYVRLDDRFINAELVAQGLANVLTIPPNTRYVTLFQRAEREARAAHRGLWGETSPRR